MVGFQNVNRAVIVFADEVLHRLMSDQEVTDDEFKMLLSVLDNQEELADE